MTFIFCLLSSKLHLLNKVLRAALETGTAMVAFGLVAIVEAVVISEYDEGMIREAIKRAFGVPLHLTN